LGAGLHVFQGISALGEFGAADRVLSSTLPKAAPVDGMARGEATQHSGTRAGSPDGTEIPYHKNQ